MKYRFFIIAEGFDPTIYKVPGCETARLISENPNHQFTIYETLQDAKQAALVIANRALSELTEDRVERYYF